MLRIITYCLITTFVSSSIWAQTTTTDTVKAAAPAPALSITGSADFYYRYNFDKQVNNYTSFTQTHNNFQLGMASVKLEHKTAKMDMVADLGFGQRAKDFAYNDNGIVQAIKQLYISYSPTAWVKFTGGTWATHVGYEVLDAYANRNYSMSYMFTNGPFSHTGVRADFTVGKSGIMIGVSNPTDWRSVPTGYINKKNLIAQYSYAPNDNIKLYLNYVGGRDTGDNKVHQFDFVGTFKFSSLFNIGVNGTLNKSSRFTEDFVTSHTWYGAAAYLNLDPAPWFGLTLREEYFSDKDGVKLPVPSKVFASTLTAQFKVDGFIFMPEFRLDNANQQIFLKSDNTGSKSTASFLFAAIYSF